MYVIFTHLVPQPKFATVIELKLNCFYSNVRIMTLIQSFSEYFYSMHIKTSYNLDMYLFTTESFQTLLALACQTPCERQKNLCINFSALFYSFHAIQL